MKTRVLMYHDVCAAGRDATSGFPGADAAAYKLETAQFAAHLKAIAVATQAKRPRVAVELTGERAGNISRERMNDTAFELSGETKATGGDSSWMLTFDDGGVSAHAPIADMLDELGWRGHFFITTDYIGTPTFLSVPQIRDLHARGHVVGSHSCSHPVRMSHCTAAQMEREWGASRRVLSDILGEAVNVASVPGGFYSGRVAAAAAEAGYKVLFTSEPVARSREVEGCLVLGRYSVQRSTAPRVAAGLAAGQLAPSLQQSFKWNAKKLAKRLGGERYLQLRKTLFARRAAQAAGKRSGNDSDGDGSRNSSSGDGNSGGEG